MAGRCRVLLRAMAGTLGLVGHGLLIHKVDPTIMGHIEDFVSERLALTAKQNLPDFMPEIPFIPTATTKVEQMFDTESAYYLSLLVVLATLVPTGVHISWLISRLISRSTSPTPKSYNRCRDFIIVGDKEAMVPSAYKFTSPPRRHVIHTSTPGAINGALTIRTAPGNMSLPAIGGVEINLIHLFHGSPAERLLLAVMTKTR